MVFSFLTPPFVRSNDGSYSSDYCDENGSFPLSSHDGMRSQFSHPKDRIKTLLIEVIFGVLKLGRFSLGCAVTLFFASTIFTVVAAAIPTAAPEQLSPSLTERVDEIRLEQPQDSVAKSFNQGQIAEISLSNRLLETEEQEADILNSAEGGDLGESIDIDPQLDPDLLLEDLIARNVALEEEDRLLSEQIEYSKKKLQELYSKLEKLHLLVSQTRAKVERVGLTGAVGLALRRQRTLPLMRALRQQRYHTAEWQAAINEAQLKIFEYDDARAKLVNVEPLISGIIERSRPSLSSEEIESLKLKAVELLSKQKELLEAINHNYHDYFELLAEGDSVEEQLTVEADNYRSYIDEHVLWIRSGEPFSSTSLNRSWRALEPFKSYRQWLHLGETFATNAFSHLFVTVIFTVIWLFWLYSSGYLKRELKVLGKRAERNSAVQMTLTWRALLFSLLLAAIGPALIAFIAWLLYPTTVTSADRLPLIFSVGMKRFSALFLFLTLLGELFRRQGVAEAHFSWPKSVTAEVRRTVKLLIYAVLPLVGIVLLLRANDPEQGSDAIERIFYIAVLLLTMLSTWQFISPKSAFMQELITFSSRSWIDRIKNFFLYVAYSLPLMIAALIYFGYHYTAQSLGERLQETLLLLFCLWLVRSIALRSLLLRQRLLVKQQARELVVTSKELAASEVDPQQIVAAQSQKSAELVSVSSQSIRLINLMLIALLVVSSWFIWQEHLPALNRLNRIAISSSSIKVIEQKVLPNGTIEEVASQRLEAVTVADLLFGLLILISTIAAARNAPGLLDMAVLLRLPLEPPVRYAIRSLAQYAIVIVGLVFAFNAVGIGWSQIQWLVAGISVGLGFGLQEIFANFVSGIIILFERPVRVGDIVTIDNITGSVSRIRTRATTITNWERKEYIIPNKVFITGKLLNWTLSDTINRIAIEVGVIYGTDTKKVCALLLDIANNNSVILKEPAPVATFEGFGESALKCMLRVYLPSTDKKSEAIHQLHTAIDDVFRREGIEMAFPQLELHMRTVPDLHLSNKQSNSK